jgi:hypothetical protein
VNVTGIPEQPGFAEAEMEILTGNIGFTTIVMELLVAGLLARQLGGRDEVNSQTTMSPLTGA